MELTFREMPEECQGGGGGGGVLLELTHYTAKPPICQRTKCKAKVIQGWGGSYNNKILTIIMGMYCCEGYSFQAVKPVIGYRNQRVLV